MTLITDEMLSAYLDGEADDALSARIETAAGDDPEVAARLERLALGDGALKSAADLILGETPASLQAALAAPAMADVVPLRPRRPAPRAAWMQLAAASIAALLVGGIGGAVLAPKGQPLVAQDAAGLALGGALAEAVSTARSGEPVRAGAHTVRVALSFRAGDGRLCRQFDVTGTAQAAAGVACRGADRWDVEGWNRRPAAATGYELASGPSDPATDAVLERLGVGEALDAEGEASAISNGWSR